MTTDDRGYPGTGPLPPRPNGPRTLGNHNGSLGTGTGAAPAPDLLSQLSGNQRDAFAAMMTILGQYSLESLAPKLLSFVQQGYSSTTLGYLLTQTDEYKERFKANDIRARAGLPVLSPAEYIATERSYRQIMQSSGMPAGFYDQPDDFVKFLANDVSPSEIKSRVDLASAAVQNVDPAHRQAMYELYGIGPNQLAAYFLDPERAMPDLEKTAKIVDLGAAAERNGLAVDKGRLDVLAGTQLGAQADYAYGQVADLTNAGSRLGEIYGTKYGQQDAEAEVFQNMQSAARKRKQLAEQELGSFQGNGGIGQTSLGNDRGNT